MTDYQSMKERGSHEHNLPHYHSSNSNSHNHNINSNNKAEQLVKIDTRTKIVPQRKTSIHLSESSNWRSVRMSQDLNKKLEKQAV